MHFIPPMKLTSLRCLMIITLLTLSSCASSGSKSTVTPTKQVSGVEKVDNINLVTNKLVLLHEMNDDIDFLEEKGMPKEDVDHLRRTIKEKFIQKVDEVTRLIRAL